jgi:hypothetical protein
MLSGKREKKPNLALFLSPPHIFLKKRVKKAKIHKNF